MSRCSRARRCRWPRRRGFCVWGDAQWGGRAPRARDRRWREAVLAQIVALVNDAQTARAPIEALADRVSAVFVPIVVSLSLLVFGVWYGCAIAGTIPAEWFVGESAFTFALLFALETMVIACPCALGLATPTAVMVASEVGARLGILLRGGGAALEAARHVDAVLLDKTGTLTRGVPSVARFRAGGGLDPVAAVVLVATVEAGSSHPLARALVDFAAGARGGVEGAADGGATADEDVVVHDSEELPGRGDLRAGALRLPRHTGG
eukprot:TRINITY_DN10141_c0_g1_i1.p1 TRINITY_DN10141_c0_g1~~TRINITY_DN10141_c0_g1_i1.p1  ORF type:complete len:264 (-),score=83.26 TRINITY_DN10141_c0_g1_i1:2-793(-)